MIKHRNLFLGLIMLFCLGGFPLKAAEKPPLSALLERNPSAAQISKQQALAMIPETCQRLDLDLAYLLAAVVYKDFSGLNTPEIFKQRLQSGWELSFQPQWAEASFPQVFHSWFYLHLDAHLDSEAQRHLKEIEVEIQKQTESLRLALPDPDAFLSPELSPHSGQRSDYTLWLSQAPSIQALFAKEKPEYRLLFRASASTASLAEHERWALATLLEEPGAQLAATAVWRRYHDHLKAGKTKALAFREASHEVEANLAVLVERGDLEPELLSAINWNTGFRPEEVFFLSGDYATAALYGSVIFIIAQQQERGIPLNEYAQMTGFYQHLPYEWLLSIKGFWIFAVADKAEYLLPAYVDHAEILGVDVRAERRSFEANATRTGIPGPVLRKYRKYYDTESQQLFVYVLDAQNHWLGTFFKTQKLAVSVPQQTWPLSAQVLPEAVLENLAAGVVYLRAR